LEYISQFPTLILSYVFESFPERIAFVGHTHTLGLYTYNGDSVTFSPIHEGNITLDSTKRHIVNAGSVGQPRDRDKHAKYVIYDTDTDNLQVRYVSYNVQETVKKIRRAGFPDYNATRLLEQ
jgi:diadenosine tetraphosphatase ApaH/serine/threonine PP2A family protein phosphatase